jgi:hypothetical protein
MGDNMIPVRISINNISINNISPEEFNTVLSCINESDDNYRVLGRNDPMTYDEIEQRYIESLMNSLEFFCGIYMKNNLIGIIKGRIESKCEKELWILSYLFFNQYRNQGNGSEILSYFENYFFDNYNINKFCVLIIENNDLGKKFWNKNGYKVARITKANKFNTISEMMILEKIIGKK